MGKRLLVTRFSAMGDVAMAASVLREVQEQNRDLEIIMVSRPLFEPFFDDIPNLKYHPIFPKDTHKGVMGIWKLFRELKKYPMDGVADLHNNLRSGILNLMFRAVGLPVVALDKGRSEKRALTSGRNNIPQPLKLSVERYADVFRELGFPIQLSHRLEKKHRQIPPSFSQLSEPGKQLIGIAPFAKHSYKVWNLNNWNSVFKKFSNSSLQFIVFGGGDHEKKIAQEWENEFPNVQSAIQKLKLSEELDLISHLDIMISMDSSGMHMASLMGTRCLSIWGATHSDTGFIGYGQKTSDCIQVAHPNRPSSVYGNKPCLCDGIEAIDLVSPEMVINKIKEVLSNEV